jgi:hypothetical protein
MSADTADQLSPLTKVDSAVQGLSSSPPKESKIEKVRRVSHSAPGVRNINELEEEGTELSIAIETQKTGWKINTSPNTVDDPSILDMPLTKPMVKKIDLHFPLGMEVTARNLKGVTIKDALHAIHKAYKKKADDELENPYLRGFEWDKEESWTRLIVHLTNAPSQGPISSKKKKKKEEKEVAAAEEAIAS